MAQRVLAIVRRRRTGPRQQMMALRLCSCNQQVTSQPVLRALSLVEFSRRQACGCYRRRHRHQAHCRRRITGVIGHCDGTDGVDRLLSTSRPRTSCGAIFHSCVRNCRSTWVGLRVVLAGKVWCGSSGRVDVLCHLRERAPIVDGCQVRCPPSRFCYSCSAVRRWPSAAVRRARSSSRARRLCSAYAWLWLALLISNLAGCARPGTTSSRWPCTPRSPQRSAHGCWHQPGRSDPRCRAPRGPNPSP